MINTRSTGTRAGAIERAHVYIDEGAFEADLARRVAIKTESQKLPASLSELRRYLEAENGASVSAPGLYHAHLRQSERRPGTRSARKSH